MNKITRDDINELIREIEHLYTENYIDIIPNKNEKKHISIQEGYYEALNDARGAIYGALIQLLIERKS